MSYEEATPQLICGSAYCMLNFITIINPTIIPSIRVAKTVYCSVNQSLYFWLGYKCNSLFEKRNTGKCNVYIHARTTQRCVSLRQQ